jgi:hypothetical protein
MIQPFMVPAYCYDALVHLHTQSLGGLDDKLNFYAFMLLIFRQ